MTASPSAAKPALTVPKALVLSKLSKLPDAAPVVEALRSADTSRAVSADHLEALLAEHRPSLGASTISAMEQLVRHGAKSGKNLFDVSDRGMEAMAVNAPVRKEASKAPPASLPFHHHTAPRHVSGEPDGILTSDFDVTLPGSAATSLNAPLLQHGSDAAFFAGNSGIHTVSRETGLIATLHAYPSPRALAMPALNAAGDTLFAAHFNGVNDVVLQALDTKTGEERWSFSGPGAFGGLTPLVLSHDEKTLFHIGSDYTLRAFHADGSGIAWTAQTGAAIGSPVVSPDGKTVCVTNAQQVLAFDALTGESRWPTGLERPSNRGPMAFSPDNKTVLVPSEEGLSSYDVETGDRLWSKKTALREDGGVVVTRAGDRALFADTAGDIHVVDAQTGGALHRIKPRLDGNALRIAGVPVLIGDDDSEAVCKCHGGEFIRVNLDDGRFVVQASSPTPPTSTDFSVTPDGGHALYFSGWNSMLSVSLPTLE